MAYNRGNYQSADRYGSGRGGQRDMRGYGEQHHGYHSNERTLYGEDFAAPRFYGHDRYRQNNEQLNRRFGDDIYCEKRGNQQGEQNRNFDNRFRYKEREKYDSWQDGVQNRSFHGSQEREREKYDSWQDGGQNRGFHGSQEREREKYDSWQDGGQNRSFHGSQERERQYCSVDNPNYCYDREPARFGQQERNQSRGMPRGEAGWIGQQEGNQSRRLPRGEAGRFGQQERNQSRDLLQGDNWRGPTSGPSPQTYTQSDWGFRGSYSPRKHGFQNRCLSNKNSNRGNGPWSPNKKSSMISVITPSGTSSSQVMESQKHFRHGEVSECEQSKKTHTNKAMMSEHKSADEPNIQKSSVETLMVDICINEDSENVLEHDAQSKSSCPRGITDTQLTYDASKPINKDADRTVSEEHDVITLQRDIETVLTLDGTGSSMDTGIERCKIADIPDLEMVTNGNDEGQTETSSSDLGNIPVLKLSESIGNEDLDDDDDDDDDDLLRAAPAFLKSVEEIIARPLPATPTKVYDSSQDSLNNSNVEVPVEVTVAPVKKLKYTLDSLLIQHKENVVIEREMEETEKVLKDDLKQGDLMNIFNKQDSVEVVPLPEDQMKVLNQFDVKASKIANDRPGLALFERDRYLCIYNSDLHPTHCGFTAGNEHVERHIASLTSNKYKRLLTSGMLQMCIKKINCKKQLLRWIFFTMAVNEDDMVRRCCRDIICDIQHEQECTGQHRWGPSMADIISVFINFGAREEDILPAGYMTNTLRDNLLSQSNYRHIEENVHQTGYNTENLKHVLQIISQSLHGHCGRYPGEDLNSLLFLLCKASLDEHLTHQCLFEPFQSCVEQVVENYTHTDWRKQRLKVCRMLSRLTDHHHNTSHLVQLLSVTTQRGMYLCRRVGFLLLHQLLSDTSNIEDDDLSNPEIKDLVQFVPCVKELLETDPYKLSSVISILDHCVGPNIGLNTYEREQLKTLLEKVQRARVRDDVSQLDRNEVKDMIARLSSKWTLDIQATKGRQTKIFEFTSPVKMKTVNLKAKIDSDSDDEPMPSKIAKRTFE